MHFNSAEINCPACYSDNYEVWGKKQEYRLLCCQQCGVIFTHLKDGCDVLAGFYDRYYDYSLFEIPPVVMASLERVVRSFEPLRHTGRWLDMGFGEGGILRVAEQYGWSCYGVDIAPQALRYGEQRGWVVTADAEADARFPAHGFDVITMIEFLEHVPRPGDFLCATARLLRPGGLLYLTTPNAQSLNQRLLGLEWSIFCPPEHLTIWTARGLQCALARAGFRPQTIRAEGFNPSEIIARLLPQNRAPVNRNQSAVAINSVLSSSPSRRALKTYINYGLSVLRIGDGLKVWAVLS